MYLIEGLARENQFFLKQSLADSTTHQNDNTTYSISTNLNLTPSLFPFTVIRRVNMHFDYDPETRK
tara:strand:- start:335 stop:532 length:198 start_codon:yes stop_codon:yes gene_type:complete